MKKHIFVPTLLATALTLLVGSCNKDEDFITLSVNTQSYSGNTKLYIDENCIACWSQGDSVFASTNTGPCTITINDGHAQMQVPNNFPLSLFYPYSTVTTASGSNRTFLLPQVQRYRLDSDGRQLVEAPMAAYAEQGATSIQFLNLCTLIEIANIPTNKDVEYITVVNGSDNLWGYGNLSFENNGAPTINYSGGDNTVILDCRHSSSQCSHRNSLYLVVPPVNYSQLTIKVFIKEDGTLKSYTANGTHSGTFIANTIYTFTLPNSPTFTDEGYTPIGSHGGLFTISTDGKKAWFSQGNLEQQPSSNTWRFCAPQYDYYISFSLTNTYSGWNQLFCWGTSGWNGGVTAYQPYATDTRADQYYLGNNANNDLTGNFANADWGVFNRISNGGMQKGLWRTLTHDEWNYLIYNRTNRCGIGKVGGSNGIRGIFLFPDNFQMPSGFAYNLNNWTLNIYSTDQWSELESRGAIFLPMVPCRNTNGEYLESLSAYWSSTTSEVNNTIWGVKLITGDTPKVSIVNTLPRSYGFCVRLVQDF